MRDQIRQRRNHAKSPKVTAWTTTRQQTTDLVAKMKRTLRGWANYFAIGNVSRAYRAVDAYAAMRLRRWLQFEHKTRGRKGGLYSPAGTISVWFLCEASSRFWFFGVMSKRFQSASLNGRVCGFTAR